MAKSHQKFFVIIAVLFVLAIGLVGCGSKEGSTSQTSQQDIEQSSNKESAETRVVKDEFGEVEIPANPKRVAGIYLEDYLLALGVTPVVQWYHPEWGTQDYLNLNAPKFDITGNIEVLLEASPDLIFVDGGVDSAKYEMYSKVAPTYRLPEAILDSPSEILETIAEVLGIPEKSVSVLNQYEQKIAEAKSILEKEVGGETVAVVRIDIGNKALRLFGIKNRYISQIYEELGLTPHQLVKDMDDFSAALSEEKIPELDVDHIIIFPSNGTWSSEENKEAIKLLDSSMWRSLPAVKKGQVYMAERTHWQSGAITANMMKIDDLLQWLAE